MKRVLIYILLFGFYTTLHGQNYHIVNFGQNLLPQPYVYSIAQDNKGYLWVGTGNGLVRYDGKNHLVKTVEDSLADNFISHSIKMNEGMLFGHMNGKLSFYSHNSFKKLTSSPENEAKITTIEKLPSNTLLIGTYSNKLLVIDEELLVETRILDNSITPSVSAIQLISENEILIGSDNGLSVYSFDKSFNFKFKLKLSAIPELGITDIIQLHEENTYLVSTQSEGLYKIKKQNQEYEVSPYKLPTEIDLSGVQHLLLDKALNLWVATFGRGLYKLTFGPSGEYQNYTRFNTSNGLSSNYVKTIFEDREGIIWSGNYGGGLSKLMQKNYAYQFFENELDGAVIHSALSDEHSYWLGTDMGLIKIMRNNKSASKLFNEEHKLPDDIINVAIQVDSFIWLGFENSGLYKFDLNKKIAKPVFIHEGVLENSITSIAKDGANLWIGTRKGACKFHVDNNKTIWYTIRNGGLPNNKVNSIFRDSKQRIWIATSSNTLAVIKGEDIQKIAFPTEKGQYVLKAINEDKTGTIWVATLGMGVFYLKAGEISNISSTDGLLSDYCYSIINDNKGNLWIGHRGGISQLITSNMHIKAIKQSFDIDPDYEFKTNACFLNNDGSVCLGFNSGILDINLLDDNLNTIPPLLDITSLRINDKEIEFSDKIKISSGTHKFDLDFIGISLKQPERVKYEFKMDGYDSESEIISENTLVYPRLTAGTYNFHLKAIDADGVASENRINIKIIIKEPFWKMPWFYIILISSLFVVTVLLIYRQKRTIELQNQILERKVEERTAKVVSQKEKIENQNIQISETNKDITDSIIYARKIQEAIATPLSDVKKLLPDSFIINMPRNIVSGDFYWVGEHGDDILFAVADSTGHGVPGAFMSVLGMSLLNSIIYESNITSPDEILVRMQHGIIRSLRQTVEVSLAYDGINMAICSFNPKTMNLKYAGAFHPLIHIRNGELNLIKSVRQTLGISLYKDDGFDMHNLKVEKGDCFYLYSDGIPDQFGGPRDKKFTSKRLRELLTLFSCDPMAKQEEYIRSVINEWKGNMDQTDDILLLGIKV